MPTMRVPVTPIVSTFEHYERLIDEDNDPVHDSHSAIEHMSRWDGPPFFAALGPLQGRRVLEVGVGTGRLAKQVLKSGCLSFTGVDFSPKTIERAARNLSDHGNVELICGNAESFVREGYFDIAYSVLTLLHVENKRNALSKMVSSLTPGGHLVLSVSDNEEWLHYGTRKLRMYVASPEQYVGWLLDLGCEVERPCELVAPDGEHVADLIKATKVRKRRQSHHRSS